MKHARQLPMSVSLHLTNTFFFKKNGGQFVNLMLKKGFIFKTNVTMINLNHVKSSNFKGLLTIIKPQMFSIYINTCNILCNYLLIKKKGMLVKIRPFMLRHMEVGTPSFTPQ